MNKFSLKKIYLLAVIICLFPCGLFAYEMGDCISCHSDNPDKGISQISMKDYRSSVHGMMLQCSECHSYIKVDHENGDVTGKVNCGKCHSQENLHGSLSGKENMPECYSCHTKHKILPSYIVTSSVNETQFKKLCVECHKTQYGESGYLRWFTSLRVKSHKKQDFSKEYDGKNCIGCHHKIEIHKKTEQVSVSECSGCHMKDNKNAMMGRFHAAGNSGSSITGISIITQIMILAVLILAVGYIITTPGKPGKGKE